MEGVNGDNSIPIFDQMSSIYQNRLAELNKSLLSSEDKLPTQHQIARLQYQVGMEYHWINEFKTRDDFFRLAMNNLDNIIAQNKKFGRTYAEKAMIIYRKGDETQALELLSQAEKLEPKYAFTLAYHGGIIYNQGNHEKASNFFRNAIEIDKSCPEAWNNLGNYYFFIKRNSRKSVECYTKATALLPFYSSAYGKLGQSFLILQENAKAEAALKKAFEILPSLGVIKLLIPIYMTLNRITEAQEYIDIGKTLFTDEEFFSTISKMISAVSKDSSTTKISEKDPLQLYSSGVYLGQRKKYADAVKMIERSIEIDDSKYYVWKDLGEVYLNWGEEDRGTFSFEQRWGWQNDFKTTVIGSKQKIYFERALQAFHRSVELFETLNEPTDFQLYMNYSKAQRVNGKMEEAEKLLKKLIEIVPQQKIIPIYHIIDILSSKKQFEEALQFSDNLLKENLDNITSTHGDFKAIAFYQRTILLVELKQLEQAKDCLKRVIEIDDNFKDIARQNTIINDHSELMELLKPKLRL